MALETIERKLAARDDVDRFAQLQAAIKPYVERYSLTEDVQADTKTILVHRTGFKGVLKVVGHRVLVELDYAFLVPKAVRNRITGGVASALDRLAADDAAQV